MPSLGPQQGEELGGGGGGPPACPSPITPTLVECEEDEGRREKGTHILRSEGWRDGCEIIDSTSLSPRTTGFMGDINVWQCGLEQPLKAVDRAVCLFSAAKIEVYLGSSNSLWSAEACHWKEFTDCSHENWINKLIYWTEMFRNQMPREKKKCFCLKLCLLKCAQAKHRFFLKKNVFCIFFIIQPQHTTAETYLPVFSGNIECNPQLILVNMICFESACLSSSDCLSGVWSVFNHYSALLRQGSKLRVFSWTDPTTLSTPRICIVACVCVCWTDVHAVVFIQGLDFNTVPPSVFIVWPSALNNKKR